MQKLLELYKKGQFPPAVIIGPFIFAAVLSLVIGSATLGVFSLCVLVYKLGCWLLNTWLFQQGFILRTIFGAAVAGLAASLHHLTLLPLLIIGSMAAYFLPILVALTLREESA